MNTDHSYLENHSGWKYKYLHRITLLNAIVQKMKQIAWVLIIGSSGHFGHSYDIVYQLQLESFVAENYTMLISLTSLLCNTFVIKFSGSNVVQSYAPGNYRFLSLWRIFSCLGWSSTWFNKCICFLSMPQPSTRQSLCYSWLSIILVLCVVSKSFLHFQARMRN